MQDSGATMHNLGGGEGRKERSGAAGIVEG